MCSPFFLFENKTFQKTKVGILFSKSFLWTNGYPSKRQKNGYQKKQCLPHCSTMLRIILFLLCSITASQDFQRGKGEGLNNIFAPLLLELMNLEMLNSATKPEYFNFTVPSFLSVKKNNSKQSARYNIIPQPISSLSTRLPWTPMAPAWWMASIWWWQVKLGSHGLRS